MEKRSLVLITLAGLAGAGCGASVRAAPANATALAASREMVRLRARLEQEQAHTSELETQVALLTSETRELHEQVSDAERERDDAQRRTIHIGHHETSEEVAEREEREEGPRPVLRLVGDPAPSAPLPPLVLPSPPPGVEARLPVMAHAAVVSPAPIVPVPVPANDEAVRAYRAALGLVEARRFTDAYAALSDFLRRWPTHPYADNAVYWRGEVRYAERQYVDALREFEDVVHRFPDGNKAPEALLKIGLCHRRMGDLARAHLFFQRVTRQYPDTDAARAAAEEDAS